jgi:hypothetical protein
MTDNLTKMPEGPFEPREGIDIVFHETLDCPECGRRLRYDKDTQRYSCYNDLCEICNLCLKLTADDVAELMNSEIAEMSETHVSGLQ